MRRKEFFESFKGQRHLLRKRRHRRLRFSWPLEPRGYGKLKSKDKDVFLKHFVKEMVSRGRMFYRSELAICLNLEVSSSSPPSIEKIPKSYIDLLHRKYHQTNPSTLSKAGKMRLLMGDDTQIKFLSVNYYVSDNNPRIWLQADRLENVVQDIALLESKSLYHSDESEDFYRDFDNTFDPEKYRSFLGDRAVSAIEYMQEKQRQCYLLNATDCSFDMLAFLLSGYARRDNNLKLLTDRLYQIFRNQILNFPSCIKLGSPPLRAGESAGFKQRTEKAVRSFLYNCKLNKPVLHPISCTVVVVQPDQTKYSKNTKDIDNFVWEFILPAIHRELAPHTTIGNIFMETYPFAGEFDGFTLQKGLPRSAIQYTIVEIPRLNSDSESGAVYMFLGKSEFLDSFWKELDRRVDRIFDKSVISY